MGMKVSQNPHVFLWEGFCPPLKMANSHIKTCSPMSGLRVSNLEALGQTALRNRKKMKNVPKRVLKHLNY